MSGNISPVALLSPGCDPGLGKLIEWLPVRYKTHMHKRGTPVGNWMDLASLMFPTAGYLHPSTQGRSIRANVIASS
jgi:hypothetical protein